MGAHNVYNGIMQGLQEAIDYKKGNKTKARVRFYSSICPIPVSQYKSTEVVTLRRTLNLSQKDLAVAIGVSPRTVESWESGKSIPSGVATRMLYLIDADNSLIDKLVVRSTI